MLSLSLVLLSCKKEDDGDGSVFTDFGNFETNPYQWEGQEFDINKDGVMDVRFQHAEDPGGYNGSFTVNAVGGLNDWEVFSADTTATAITHVFSPDTIIVHYKTDQVPVIYSQGDSILSTGYRTQGAVFYYADGNPSMPGMEYTGYSYGAEIPDDWFYVGLIMPGESASLAWIKLKIRGDTFILNSSRCYAGVRNIVIK